MYVNVLTESERLNDTEYRSETCSEAKLIVVRPERTEPLPRTHVLSILCYIDLPRLSPLQFNPSLPISAEISGFKKNTTLKDKVHCVCIVIDGSTAGVLPEKMLEKIKAIQAKIHVRGTGFLSFTDLTLELYDWGILMLACSASLGSFDTVALSHNLSS